MDADHSTIATEKIVILGAGLAGASAAWHLARAGTSVTGFRGLKVAQYNGGPAIGSVSSQTGVIGEENRALMSAYVESCLPGLDPQPYAETTCLFTNTPTEDFVIDAADDVVVLSACSGHGATFAALLGELAGDLLLGTGSVPAEFRLSR